MAHVLILSLTFPPDNVSTAQYMGDIAEDAVSRGHRVTVLTTMPHFNNDPIAEQQQPIRPFWGRLLRRSQFRGASVYHTLMPKKRPAKAAQMVGWLVFHSISLVAGFILPRHVDVILTTSPPLTAGLEAWLLGLRHRAPIVYCVQELYPDLAVNLGVIRSRRLVAVLYRLEKLIYAKSTRIAVISPHIREHIIEKGVPPQKVVYMPNWVDPDSMQPIPKDNPFSRRHGVQDLFVVNYAGNLGLAQTFDEFLEAAQELCDDYNIRFMLIGGGVERGNIAMRVKELGLSNLMMLPHQPYNLVPEIYGSCDLSFVPLHHALGRAALPSKVYRIMAAERAILALADPTSDLANLIDESGCGFVVAPDSGRRLAEVILEASRDPERLRTMGAVGRIYVQEHFSRDLAVARYLALFDELASGVRS